MTRTSEPAARFAVVGMDCLLPGAPDAETWIRRGLAGEQALAEVPAGRWPIDPAAALARGTGPDGTATLVGGFVDDDGTPTEWVTRVATGALDSVHATRERTSLLLANLSLPSTGAVKAAGVAYRDWLNTQDVDTSWLDGADPEQRWMSGAPALEAAKSLGLGGTAFALDAACASSLYAVKLACDRLAAGLDDCVIAAGLQRADSSFLFLGFTQLQALSSTGTPRPLDHRANGLCVGEGAAAVALKRLEDAERDGDTIHAVIVGGALGNDGRSGNMLAPSATGQERALRQAWSAGDLDALGYVECHATGTAVGDGVEVEALASLMADRDGAPVVLSSTKGLIGHTITVAGLAGLIRAVGAVREGVLPGTPGIEPRPLAPGLEVLDAPRPWTDESRCAGVSAFGFGGTNAHVRVENYRGPSAPRPHTAQAPITLAITAVRSRIGEVDVDVSRGLGTTEGRAIADVSVDPGRFRLPPRELADLLPQQLLALDLAARAVADDGQIDGARTGAVLGMGIDANVADHVIRWVAGDSNDVSSALTSSRVQGLLPNFVANRLAAQLGLEGPSWTCSAESLSALVAVEQAALMLSTDAVDAVLVGAVDLPLHPGFATPSSRRHGQLCEAGAVLVVRRADEADADAIIATLTLEHSGAGEVPAPAHHNRLGHGESADGALALLEALEDGGLVELSERGRSARIRITPGPATPKTDLPAPARSLPMVTVSHSGPTLEMPGWTGSWADDTVPAPRPRTTPPTAKLTFSGTVQDETATPLSWPEHRPAPAMKTLLSPPAAQLPPVAPPPTPTAPRAASPASATHLAREAQALADLAAALQRSTAAATAAHTDWLRTHTAASQRMASAALQLTGATPLQTRAPAMPTPVFEAPPSFVPPAVVREAPPAPVQPQTPELFDLDALKAFAEGTLSSCLGPDYADLDGYAPRVRLPMDPLLLVSRVVDMDAERGPLKPATLVTEYDLPHDAVWVDRGKPPVSVVIESGQADLFLVSVLGVDEHCKGERLYRLLDCDLTFHGPRPDVGETLRHDIRIKNFATLGGKILFYFEYDCTSRTDGRRVLTMRNGVAGFFTPAELAVPQGVDPTPSELRAEPILPLIPGAATSLEDAAMRALRDGDFKTALGNGFSVCDGAELRPPTGPWALIHRAPTVELTGGPHGLGRVIAEQDLDDDDWFNSCHFKDDPCMPGTLMFDGCTQALQLWLLAAGVAGAYPDAHFEPIADQTARLRCRGQVVPGQSKVTYDARITSAGMEPHPWVIADVLLLVDGTPVVMAEGVSLCVDGERIAIPEPEPLTTVSETELLEFAVGRPSVAFGPALLPHDDGSLRCPRIPGPPLALIHEAVDVRAVLGQLEGNTGVTMRTRVPSDSPYFEAAPGRSMPLVALMEIALQPCGWLTAWEGAALGKGDVYFRNLGGTATVTETPWQDIGALVVEATLTSVSESAGMVLTFFDFKVTTDDGRLITEGDTHFGYFSKAALAAQKGLGLDGPTTRRLAEAGQQGAITPVVPEGVRDDWRMIDRVVCADATGGASGLGFYAAEVDVDPDAWFFTAHFHQDPVMPGSLGIEGLGQLAVFALGGEGPFETPTSGSKLDWKYRGQVTRDRKLLRLEIEVTERTDDGLVCTGWLTADGTPIYSVEGLAVRRVEERVIESAEAPIRPAPTAALLDTFTATENEGTGSLRLDPAVHPWLSDHCPTLVIPAVPMAFAIEIAAEAALQLRPGKVVIGAPKVTADRWIAADEPVDLLIAAVADGDHVAVSLAMHHENTRFPALSGPKVHMAVVIELADAYPAQPDALPALTTQPVSLSARAYYDEGHTFHGPALQGMIDLGERGEQGALSTFQSCVDAELLGEGVPNFVLDPLLLDVATHPMMSSAPETWGAKGPGTLAYPIAAEGLRFYGPRPAGEVTCRLDLVEAGRTLVFDVRLTGVDGVWASFRWTEAVVDGGLLGLDASAIRAFCVGGDAIDVRLGSAHADGWRVGPEDLAEPLEGSLVRLLGRPEEIATWQAADDAPSWLAAWLAVKESVRQRVRDELGRDIHPRDLRVLELASGWIVVEATTLTSQEHLDVLGPTRYRWVVREDGSARIAHMA
ncbi:MAG: polyketide synthase dehydratase domain-containing protein [Proteobacteria bacterium]|nr:polyketide synthase dehydratase domain-containing protein [Pseudomonadota bacterium]